MVSFVFVVTRLGDGREQPNEGGLRLAAGVSEVEDQRKVSVVDSDARDVDDASDALLFTSLASISTILQPLLFTNLLTLDSSESWNILTVYVRTER